MEELIIAEPLPLVEAISSPPAPPSDPRREAPPTTLGPWYHTGGIVLLLLVYAFVAHLTHRATGGSSAPSTIEQRVGETARAIAETPKVPLYLSTVMLSWMLLACVVAGLYHRRAFFLNTLRCHFRSRWIDPAIGLAIYLSFLSIISLCVFVFTGVLLARARATHTRPSTTSAQTHSGTSPKQEPSSDDTTEQEEQDTQAVQQHVQHILRLNPQAVASLAPHTVPQLLLWIGLSLTAGFCEEHIFRGYLLSQSIAAMRRLAMPPWLAATLSVLTTSVLFGSLHLYEGVGGAVIVGLLGAAFAIMTLLLGNLRAVIVAHFLQDFFGGLIYYIAHLRHAL